MVGRQTGGLTVEDHYIRTYEDVYSVELVEQVRSLFEGDAPLTEAFFALHGQLDMLVEEHDVRLSDGEKQVQDNWNPELVLEAVDEVVMLAKQQNSPAWPSIMAIAAAMRVIVRTVPIMPPTEFPQDEAAGIPPGLFALMQREDTRPFEFAVAAVSNDLPPESMVGAAVLAERVRCEAAVKERIKDVAGDKSPDELDPEVGWTYEQLERARAEIACEQAAES